MPTNSRYTPYLLELNVKIIFIVFRMLVEVVTFIAILFFYLTISHRLLIFGIIIGFLCKIFSVTTLCVTEKTRLVNCSIN